MRVGIRELKSRLSELVERAAAGEVVTITYRGRAKAELRPLSERSRIEQGIAEGWITPPEQPGGLARPDRKRFKSRVRTEDVIAEDRAERF
jgi:prevent-host-death family protein